MCLKEKKRKKVERECVSDDAILRFLLLVVSIVHLCIDQQNTKAIKKGRGTVGVVHEAETAVDRAGVDFTVEALVKVLCGLEPDSDLEEAGLGVLVVRGKVENAALGGGVEAV